MLPVTFLSSQAWSAGTLSALARRASLAGLPELAARALCSIVLPAAQKPFENSRCPRLQALPAQLLLFDFVDSINLPRKDGLSAKLADNPSLFEN